jgi:hypothetical protein
MERNNTTSDPMLVLGADVVDILRGENETSKENFVCAAR